MPTYDAVGYNPPAPIALVVLRHPDTGRRVSDVPMLIDTGADATLLPRDAVMQLGNVEMNGQYEVVGFDGSTQTVSPVRLDVLFLGRTFKGRYLLIDQSYGVLGRNLLNALSLVLDGPRLMWYDQRPTVHKA